MQSLSKGNKSICRATKTDVCQTLYLQLRIYDNIQTLDITVFTYPPPLFFNAVLYLSGTFSSDFMISSIDLDERAMFSALNRNKHIRNKKID